MRITRSKAFRFFILCSLFLTLHSPASAQDREYAHRIIDTLCSPYFAGRGYVEDGYKKAADFLEAEFQSIGLESITDAGFQQPFTMPVNTFPGIVKVGLSRKENKRIKWLGPGKDFLIDPASNGCQAKTFKFKKVDSLYLAVNDQIFIEKLKPGTSPFALTYTARYKSGLKDWSKLIRKSTAGAAVELADKNLIWSISHDTMSIPVVRLKKDVLKRRHKYISLEIEQKYIPNYTSSNVIAVSRNPLHPDTFIVIGAHLDHLGKMGKDAAFPGANDNASGIAMLLDMARYFSQPHVRDELPFSIIFIGFGAEEAGLVGSKYFVENSPVPLSKIGFMVNMDLMGNGQDGMMVVNGSVYQEQYDKLSSLNGKRSYLKEIKSRGKAANSDHYWFSENGVPSFFFYLLGDYPWYHDIYDTPEKPNLVGYEGAFKLITEFVKEL